ncbi:MAG: hypothetical protein ACE5EO_08570 [Candidatus Krumholzibacteriia bacterium]
MRSLRVVITIGLVSALALAAACSRHAEEDLLAFPALVQSPAPDSLRVTTSNDIEYGLKWFMSDVSNVQFYRVYNLDPFTGAPVFLDSTVVDTTTVNTLIPTPGIVFGISSVSTGSVESSIVFGAAPSP